MQKNKDGNIKKDKIYVFRHGEYVLELIDSLPNGLTASKTNVLGIGKTGNSHTFKGGTIYPKDEDTFIVGYLKAKNTFLFHTEHSPKGAKIKDGFYRIRKHNEFINGELKQVID